ncbi:hypothetical protein Q7P36_011287 [Cladosporium allicinum]
MAVKGNNPILKNHFRKDWQRRVRVHFDQPGKKASRRNTRKEKAARVAPKPVDKLRPIVRCPTVKYNRRVRAGRGFSLAELKEANIPRKLARTIGISVDPRRQNLSEESLKVNAPKKGEASAEEVKAVRDGDHVKFSNSALPINNKVVIQEEKLSENPSTENAYRTLRDARSEARLIGKREKRAKAKAEEEENKKK